MAVDGPAGALLLAVLFVIQMIVGPKLLVTLPTGATDWVWKVLWPPLFPPILTSPPAA
jgi:hypothetical protein